MNPNVWYPKLRQRKFASSALGWCGASIGMILVVAAMWHQHLQPTTVLGQDFGEREVAIQPEPKLEISVVPCIVALDVKSIHDGDTITADMRLPWGITLRDQKIRAVGYDAWEIDRTRKTVQLLPGELEKGKAARDALLSFQKKYGLYAAPAHGKGDRDAYGRTLAILMGVDKHNNIVDLSEFMIEGGFTRPKQ